MSFSCVDKLNQRLWLILLGLLSLVPVAVNVAYADNQSVISTQAQDNQVKDNQVKDNQAIGSEPQAIQVQAQAIAPAPAKPVQSSPADYKAQSETLLQSPAYSNSHEQKGWQETDETEASTDNWLVRLLRWLFGRAAGDGVTQAAGVVAKGLALLLLAVLVYLFIKNFDKFKQFAMTIATRNAPMNTPNIPTKFMDMNDGLPPKNELSSQVAALITQGQFVMALSLLYRGTLRELSIHHALPISPADTESQCQTLLKTAQHTTPNELGFFNELIYLWQLAAYGKRLPTNAKETLNALNAHWQRIYLGHTSITHGGQDD